MHLSKYVIALALIVGFVWYGHIISSYTKAVATPLLSDKSSAEVLDDNTFSYPRLGIKAPISLDSQTDPLRLQDWGKISESLKSGVSASFTEESYQEAPLVFVTGHSSDYYPHDFAAVFAPLSLEKKDDIFHLKVNDEIHSYKVLDKKIIVPTDLDAFRELKPNIDQPQRVALVTCWPLLTTKNRLVVIAEKI